jgi:hypothetical protein
MKILSQVGTFTAYSILERTIKQERHARKTIVARGGELWVSYEGDRVTIAGTVRLLYERRDRSLRSEEKLFKRLR